MFAPVKKLLIVLTALLLLSLLGHKVLKWYENGRFIEETDNAYIQADTVSVRPEISGRIQLVAVSENQQVKQGQLLIQIDPADFQAKVMQAEAQLAVSHAAASDAKAQLELQYRSIEEASANIDAAKAELHRSKLELNRFSALEKQSFDSKQQVQNAQAYVDVAKAKLAQSQAAKAAAQQMQDVLKAKIESANAQISVVRSELTYAQNQLDKTAILAPSDGIIGNMGARVGSSAQPTMTLLHLVPLPNIYVVANFKETQITHMTIGQPVSLKVDAQPDIPFTGIVESLSPATGTEFSLLPGDNATGNFNKIVQRVPVRIRVTGPEDALPMLRPGLSVIPEVDTRNFKQQVSYLQNKSGNNSALAVQSPH